MKEIQAIGYIRIRDALDTNPDEEIRFYMDRFMDATVEAVCLQISKRYPKELVEYCDIRDYTKGLIRNAYFGGKEVCVDSAGHYYKITESGKVYNLADGENGIRWKFLWTHEPCDE